ncbi:NUDIX domain-containing protein [Candidatus Phyllobacterium onerii]|uniref:NUDIX domain-containing protein n=1 Tax=Candidatus Phyllobacterium onerii TaxID=3020828 RepID=UPI003A857878
MAIFCGPKVLFQTDPKFRSGSPRTHSFASGAFTAKASGEGWSLPAGAIEPGETPQAAVRAA